MNRSIQFAEGIAVLRLTARGWPQPEIAAELHMTVDVVKRRLRFLYEVLGARNSAHAVAIAGMERVLSAEDLRAAVADRRPGWKPENEREA